MDLYPASHLYSPEVEEIFRYLLEPRLRADEDLDDVIAGGYAIAAARAGLRRREPFPLDAEFAFSLWCWFPLKPDVPELLREQVQEVRASVFQGCAAGDLRPLGESLTEATVLLSHEDLYRLQGRGQVEALLRFEGGPTIGA